MQHTLTDSELLRVQALEQEMLIEVDRICRKCGIHYNIIAGTLLGAVRHGGFIPWDDDADVAFLRPEYEKFRKACETELDHSRFYFQDHRNTPGYRWGYGKLRRKESLFLREYQEDMPYEQGVFIDIFPLDKVPHNKVLRTVHNFHCFAIRKFLWSEVGRKADQNPARRVLYALMSKVPLKAIFRHYARFARYWNKKPSDMVRILTFPTPNKEYGYRMKWYKHSTDHVFEGHTFRGIRDYDAYLSFKFGDYMSLPPEEQRKVHPVSKLVLPR